MIGWLVVGAMIGESAKKQERKKAERAQRRLESPMPNAVWVIYGILAVSAIASPPAIPGMLIIGVCIWMYAQKRRREHEAWKATQQPAVPLVDYTAQAHAYERLGMPVSAQAMRDLHEIGQPVAMPSPRPAVAHQFGRHARI